MSNLVKLSAVEMREGLLKGDFSATELMQEHLTRIEQTNPEYNSLVHITAKRATEKAALADSKIKELGKDSPVFTGIPVTIKDLLATKGVPTTAASNILRNFVPPYSATAVSRLRKAGAILVAKANLDEFAMGSSNESSVFGPVKNPWDTTRVSGGSSGGSAVSVALGQSPISLGTDTGGSIRQPAAFCGVLGLKPTYGRVSRYGAIAYASSLDQIGPIARNTEDIALTLSSISGKDHFDATSMDMPVPNYLSQLRESRDDGIRGMRIGVAKEYFIDGIEPGVEKQVRAAMKTLESLGAQLVDISLPHTPFALATYYILALAEASSNLSRYDGVRFGLRSASAKTLRELYEISRAEGFGKEVKKRILLGTHVLSTGYFEAYYTKAQQVRSLIIQDFEKVFEKDCDAIIAPTAPTTAFQIGEHRTSALQMYLEDVFTVPINLAGLPAISIPCGLDEKNLPVGMQIIGRVFDEASLLTIADQFLKAAPFDSAAKTN